MIFRLDENLAFPDPALAEADGLLAVGGDLSVERLKLAYQNGIFPWFSEGDPILWFSPHERCVIYPERLHISHSLRKTISSGKFEVTLNKAFEEVIRACATVPRKDQDGTWITAEMQAAYIRMHGEGLAHSVEIWENDALVGGIYGIVVKAVFCGESMFSRATDASKVAMAALCASGAYEAIDCQLPNPHLMSLGAEMLSREAFMKLLIR